jgi:PH domain
MDTEDQNKDLKAYLKVKRKLFWVKRFIVLKSTILYYYRNSTSPVPRGIYHIEGSSIEKETKDLVIEITKNSNTLKIQFASENEFNTWFQHLSTVSKETEKQSNLSLNAADFQKVMERENLILIEQIPKTNMQSLLNTKIKLIIDKKFRIVGTRGSSVFAVDGCWEAETLNNKDNGTLRLLGFLVVLEVLGHLFYGFFGFMIVLACLVYAFWAIKASESTAVEPKYTFRCTVLIKSSMGEILTALHDTLCRQAWEPYLIDCNEFNTINLLYSYKSANLRQEITRVFIKESSHYYIIEKSESEIKNLFKIETKNKKGQTQCQVTHYGTMTNNLNPIIGNPDILSCLKVYVESTVVYISSKDFSTSQVNSDEDSLN